MPTGNLLVGLGFICGTLIAAQGAINGRLAGGIGGPIHAALISFSVGWLALLAGFSGATSGATSLAGLQKDAI